MGRYPGSDGPNKRRRSPSPLQHRDTFIRRDSNAAFSSRYRQQSPFEPSRKIRRSDDDNRSYGRDNQPAPPQRHSRLTPQERERLRAQGGCFYCREVTNPRHGASQCPKKIAAHGPSPSEFSTMPPRRNNFAPHVGRLMPKREDTPSDLNSGGSDRSGDVSEDGSEFTNAGLESLLEDGDSEVLRDETEPINDISPHEPGSRYRFNFGKYKGLGLLSTLKTDSTDRFGGMPGYIEWMKNEHMPVQYGKEDLADGIEHYHRKKLADFEASHPYASEYVFKDGKFKGKSISEVPDWYVYELEEQGRMTYYASGFDGYESAEDEEAASDKLKRKNLAEALEWRKKRQDTNRWMWNLEKGWYQKKKKGLHRTEFSWKPKLLGPFAYPTTLSITDLPTRGPYPCKCPTCTFGLEGGNATVKERPSEKKRRQREEWESSMYDVPWF